MALRLPSIVWKHLVSDPITPDDVRAIDLLSFQIVSDIQALLNKKSITQDAFDSVMAERKFEVYGSDQVVYPLIPGGHTTPITFHNARLFCDALTKYRLSEFANQCEAMRRGLSTVVPLGLLSMFTWQELEKQVVGSSFDVDLLFEMTKYESCSVDDLHVKLFWQMMRERFNDADRSRFLSFVWGRSRLPTSKQGFGDANFKIQNYNPPRNVGDVNKMLPVSHTCFCSLELPRYTNLDAIVDRLTYAMQNCAVIDGDSARQHEVISNDIDDIDDDRHSLF